LVQANIFVNAALNIICIARFSVVLQSQQIEKVKHRTLIWVKKKKQAFSTDMIFIFYHSISAGSRL